MPALRVCSLAVIAVWIGGLLALGIVVAPAVFGVLEAHDPLAGRMVAGLVFGDIFERFQRLAWVLGGLKLGLLGLRAALGPRPRRLAVQIWLVAAMLAVSAYAGLVVAPRIDVLRDAGAGTMAGLADSDPRRIEFGRLHGLSNGLMAATILAGLCVFWIEARE